MTASTLLEVHIWSPGAAVTALTLFIVVVLGLMLGFLAVTARITDRSGADAAPRPERRRVPRWSPRRPLQHST